MTASCSEVKGVTFDNWRKKKSFTELLTFLEKLLRKRNLHNEGCVVVTPSFLESRMPKKRLAIYQLLHSSSTL